MDLHDDSGKIANLEVFVWHSYFLCFFFTFLEDWEYRIKR